jgi:hypothetical protein
VHVLFQLLLQDGDGGVECRDSIALLLDVDLRRRSNRTARFDQRKDPLGIVRNRFREAKALLQRKYLKVGIGHRCGQRHRDGIAVEGARGRQRLRRLRGSAVLAPEVDLVGREAERILGARRLQVRPLAIAAIQRPIERQHGIERRPGNLGSRARLGDPCGRRLEVIVRLQAVLHECGQFGTPKAPPPTAPNRDRVL